MATHNINGIPVWGDPAFEDAVAQIKMVSDHGAEKVALMADHHVGYSMPIGGVAAYRVHVSPSGVGYDIACGNKAILTDMPATELKRKIHVIMDDIASKISFGIGRKNQEEVDHDLFDDLAWKLYPAIQLKDKARAQLGTVGSGNHYVDLFVDELERVWIGVHFGSRGLGHGIASHFIEAGGGGTGMHSPPVLLHQDSNLGSEYIEQMRLAGLYAYAGRDWVCQKVAKILKAKVLEEVHNHHNFAWRETHGDTDYWVVRKGATPAFPGQRGFIGGSMGDISVIVEGIANEHSTSSLFSTVHGAGRVMSRTKAAGRKKGRKREGGAVTREMMEKWLARERVVLRGGGTDESPHCYKRLPEVLAHHEETLNILHTLQPVGVAMAGEDEFDPFKD